MDFMTTRFKPFDFSWQRTKEINALLNAGYVFPALTDAILLPDMFGYKYNDKSDGNTEDERHYKGWCKNHFSLYEHPEGTDITDYNLLNPNLCYKIRNYIVHGTKISVDGKDDLNKLFQNPQSKVGKQFKDVEFRLVSAIFQQMPDGKKYECEKDGDDLLIYSSVRNVKNDKLFVAINALALCYKLIREIDADYRDSTDEEKRRYDANYLCNRQIIVNEIVRNNHER